MINQPTKTNCCGTTNTDCCSTTDTAKRPQNYRAPVDVYETKKDFRVTADMPGTCSEQIEISADDNMLVIDAEVSNRYDTLGTTRHQEYGVGDFHRSFRIGDGINADSITATYRDGVLSVSLSKAEAIKPRKIDIKDE
jgi:HSP20 family protein|tara:strand:+ start:316 stop:729 length:414 start_codon:yes stop_codon:yes gene_type:complete